MGRRCGLLLQHERLGACKAINGTTSGAIIVAPCAPFICDIGMANAISHLPARTGCPAPLSKVPVCLGREKPLRQVLYGTEQRLVERWYAINFTEPESRDQTDVRAFLLYSVSSPSRVLCNFEAIDGRQWLPR